MQAKNKIEKLPEDAQIELISVAKCIDIKGTEQSGPILKTVVKQVYSANSKALNKSKLTVMKVRNPNKSENKNNLNQRTGRHGKAEPFNE